jgi:hypothetical protein
MTNSSSRTAVTYIVSTYDRPRSLRMTLASLQVQTDTDFEVIVADNNPTTEWTRNWSVVDLLQDNRFKHFHTANYANSPGWDCYHSAEWVGNEIASGDYICCPSDDSYYVPVFQETMLAKARAEDLGLVYCDMLYDRRIGGKYSVLNVQPRSCAIDKTGFMVRRDCWIGFPTKPQTLSSSCCDGEMIEELVRRGVRHGKVEECLVVHN